MKVGFTGSREGMTARQRMAFVSFFHGKSIDAFHHGCCIGADEQAHAWVNYNLPTTLIVGHPPIKTQWRMELVPAYNVVYRDPAGYLIRDRAIVDVPIDVLIACPKEMVRPKRGGGTWYTYGYADGKCERILILPDGTVHYD